MASKKDIPHLSLIAAGTIVAGFSIFHFVTAPAYFDWIGIFMAFFAFITLVYSREMIDTSIGRASAIFITAIYLLRSVKGLMSLISGKTEGSEFIILIFCLLTIAGYIIALGSRKIDESKIPV